MFYAIATADWTPERALTLALAPGGLFRTRASAREAGSGRTTLAVAVRYDATRGRVVAHGAESRRGLAPWHAPAILDRLGRLTVLAPIPASLVRVVGPAEVRIHRALLRDLFRPHRPPASVAAVVPSRARGSQLLRGPWSRARGA